MAEQFQTQINLDTSAFIAGLNKVITAANKAGVDIEKALQIDTNNIDTKPLVNNLKNVEAQATKTGGSFSALFKSFKDGQASASSGGGMLGGLAGSLGSLATPAGAATAAIGALTAGFAATVNIGKEFETNLAGVSAVTGLTGNDLDALGERAIDLSKKFGGDASTQLKSFQGVLSKFGADLAKTPDALGKVADNINVLAKAGGLDAAQSMDVLANSMLQFGVDVANPNEAVAESTRYINVLAASARVGAAEIPQVGEAVLVAGVQAKKANVSFEETNAAIQVLAAGGKVGAEAGTALRNVLGKIAGEDVIPKEALAKLKSLGVDMKKVSNTAIPLSDRLQELGKASKDATAFAQVFGTENAAAASILADGAGTVKDWTKQITGTTDANKQAATNMATFGEAMSRLKANIEAIAISVYKFISPALSFLANSFANLFSGDSENPMKPIIESFQKFYAQVKPIIEFVANILLKQLEIQLHALKSAAGVVFDFISSLFTGLSGAFKPLIDKFQELFGAVGEGESSFEGIKKAITVFYDVVSGVLQVALGIVVKYIGTIVSVVASMIGILISAGKWVIDISNKFYTWVTSFDVVKKGIAAITKTIEDFIGGVKSAYDAVVKFLGLQGDVPVNTSGQTKQSDANNEVTKTVAKQTETINENSKAKDANDKKGKTALQTAQDTLKIENDKLEVIRQQAENAILIKAANDKRKLTDEEIRTIEEGKLQLQKDQLANAKRILGITGDGANLQLGIAIGSEEKTTAQGLIKKFVDDIGNVATAEIKFSTDKASAKSFKEQIDAVLEYAKDNEIPIGSRVEITKESLDNFQNQISDLRDRSLKESDKFQSDSLLTQAKTLDKELNALRKQYQDLIKSKASQDKEYQDKKRTAEILAIEDNAQREIAEKVYSLEKQRDAALDNELLTETQKLVIRKRFQKQIDDVQAAAKPNVSPLVTAYEIATKSIKGNFQDLADFLNGSISRSAGAIGGAIDIQPAEMLNNRIAQMSGSTDDLKKQLEQVNNEQKELNEQFLNGAAGYRDNADKITELAQRKADIERQIEEKKSTFIKSLYVALYSELSKLSEQSVKDTQAAFTKLTDITKTYSDAQKTQSEITIQLKDAENQKLLAAGEVVGAVTTAEMDAAQLKYDDAVKKINELQAKKTASDGAVKDAEIAATDARTNALNKLGENFAIQAATMLASGEDVSKQLKGLAFNTISSLIDMYVPSIFASFLSFLGPFALPAAGLAVAGLKALLKSVAGFKDGGEVQGKEQLIRINEVGQEFVVNHKATKKEKRLLDYINKGGSSEDYFKNNMQLSNTVITNNGELSSQAQVNLLGSINNRLIALERNTALTARNFENYNKVDLSVQHDEGVLIRNLNKKKNLNIRRG